MSMTAMDLAAEAGTRIAEIAPGAATASTHDAVVRDARTVDPA
jgi:hypothetical protein